MCSPVCLLSPLLLCLQHGKISVASCHLQFHLNWFPCDGEMFLFHYVLRMLLSPCHSLVLLACRSLLATLILHSCVSGQRSDLFYLYITYRPGLLLCDMFFHFWCLDIVSKLSMDLCTHKHVSFARIKL